MMLDNAKGIASPSVKRYLHATDPCNWELPLLFKTPTSNSPVGIDTVLRFIRKHKFGVYGSPCFKWNGGRQGEIGLSLDEISNSIKRYNEMSINCFCTFTNYFLTQNDLSDPLGNAILDMLDTNSGNNGNNGVIISNDKLRDYIRRTHPNLILKCSILKSSYECYDTYGNDFDWYLQMFDLFNIVVVHPDISQHILYSLPHKDQIEILVNEACRKRCPNRRTCYLPHADGSHHRHASCAQNNDAAYSVEYVQQLQQVGFSRFKIQGR